jgi:hypothetical protein
MRRSWLPVLLLLLLFEGFLPPFSFLGHSSKKRRRTKSHKSQLTPRLGGRTARLGTTMDQPNGSINTMDAMSRLAKIANVDEVTPGRVISSLGARVWRQAIEQQASLDSAGHAVSSLMSLIEKLINSRATKTDSEISDKVSMLISTKFVNSEDNKSLCKLRPITDILDQYPDVMQQRQKIQSNSLIKEWMEATITELINIGAHPPNMAKPGKQHAMHAMLSRACLQSMPVYLTSALADKQKVSHRPHNHKQKILYVRYHKEGRYQRATW